jgi:uncharacterized protein
MRWISLKLVALCTVLFFLQLFSVAFENSFVLVSADIFSRPWILVTHIFLHADFLHLFYNMFALGLFGTILEGVIGDKKFLQLYFTGGIVAGLAASFFYPAGLGASGAIMAVMGCLAILRPRMKVYVGYVPMPMIAAATIWALGDFFGMIVPGNVANAAHLGGLFFGVLVGFYLKKQYGEKASRSLRNIPEKEFQLWENKWM